MQRRDVLSKVLLSGAAVAGSAALTQKASAQSCTAPCYAVIPNENPAFVVDYSYPPGNVRRYGAVSAELDPVTGAAGLPDCTTAIKNANDVSRTVGIPLYFPAGNYRYAPVAGPGVGPLSIDHMWEGASLDSTNIYCDTSAYSGEFFRITGSCELRNLGIRTVGGMAGTGVRISAPSVSNNTGHVRLTRVYVAGFSQNIRIEHSFMVMFDQVRSEDGGYGVVCQPVGPGYITTHLHLNCFYTGNAVNIFYNCPTLSANVTFIGGAHERATAPYGANGSGYSAFFGGVVNLHFIDWYIESNPADVVIAATTPNVTFDGLYANASSIYLGSNVSAKFSQVRTINDSKLRGGDGTQRVLMEFSHFTAQDNSTYFASFIAFHSSVYTTQYTVLLPS